MEHERLPSEHLISPDWLMQLGFGVTLPEKGRLGNKYPVYYFSGLHLTYWDAQASWRWQIGGTDNMWEALHMPTKAFILSILVALGRRHDDQIKAELLGWNPYVWAESKTDWSRIQQLESVG